MFWTVHFELDSVAIWKPDLENLTWKPDHRFDGKLNGKIGSPELNEKIDTANKILLKGRKYYFIWA